MKLAQQLMAEEDDDEEDENEDADNGSSTQDSVQMQTDQPPNTDIANTGANGRKNTKNSGTSALDQKTLAETTMDEAGHLETQIN